MESPSDDLDLAIERWMRERPAPAAPPEFTASVLARVRRERWRSEWYLDLAFNTTVAVALLLVIAGVLGLVYASGLTVIGRDLVLLFAEGLATTADQVAPSLPVYLAASALTFAALGLWWAAENH